MTAQPNSGFRRPVLYVARLVPTYRRPVLERLNQRLGGRLVVACGQPPTSSYLGSITPTCSTDYREIRLPNWWLGNNAVHAQPYGRAFRECPAPSVVLAEESPRSITLPFLLKQARKRGARRLLWGHFSSNSRAFGSRNALDRYRIHLAQSVEACVCYTDCIADLLRPFVPEERLFVATNTIDTDTLGTLNQKLSEEGRAAVRKRVGLSDDEVAIAFIGRLKKAKGMGRLLETFRALRAKKKATLFIIGAGPEETAIRRYAKRHTLDDVHFLGAMPEYEDSAPYLYASDVMLIPSYVGLALNHSFALGLPIVTRRSPNSAFRYHGPEIAYLHDGQNGRLARSGSVEDLIAAVEDVVADHKRYSLNALAYAQEHLTLRKMVDGLVEAIRFAEGC